MVLEVYMPIKLIEESEVTEGKKSEKRQECACPVVVNAKKSLKIISAEKIIKCERRERGMTSSCAICEGISKEMFDRCKNKWTDY